MLSDLFASCSGCSLDSVLPLVGVHQGFYGLFVVCFFVYLQSPVVSSVIECDPVVMVSSPRPLPPVHDLKQLGLPSSLTQASVHTHAPVCAYMHASVRSCVRGWVGVCVRACVHACVRACVHACVRAFVCAYVGVWVRVYIHAS